MKKLTPKQLAFIDAYLLCRNGAEAARCAGYSKNSARITASKLLTKANIQLILRAKIVDLAANFDLTKAKIINELKKTIRVASEESNPLAMIRGWVEIAKLLDYYDPKQTIASQVESNNNELKSEFASMSDEELLNLIQAS